MSVHVIHADCRDAIKEMADCSIDSCVTDPPYHLTSIVKRFANANAETEAFAANNPVKAYRSLSRGFMGKQWDGGDIAFQPETWREVLRVLKPGGHLLSFGGTRTYHRMTCAIEDAGFEIRDMTAWLYGSGFPKSHDVSKAIDRAAGAERKVLESIPDRWAGKGNLLNRNGRDVDNGSANIGGTVDITAPATDAARQWEGWGTALKPALEPICLARKPLIGTVAANVLQHGTGALNIDGCRIATDDKLGGGGEKAETAGKFTNEGWRRPWMDDPAASEAFAAKVRANVAKSEALGRWPANVIHDGSDEVVAAFPETQSGEGAIKKATASGYQANAYGKESRPAGTPMVSHGDSGSAARFFYSAKADSDDRLGSKHPTVKPVDLIAYLCRLITPPGGTILDPFAGSGTTGMAAMREGFNAILIEREAEYIADIKRRIAHVQGLDAPLFAEVAAQ